MIIVIFRAASSLTVNELIAACSDITAWHALGLRLYLTMPQLKEIENDYKDGERQKAEMFDVWLRSSPNASWKELIAALKSMGEFSVAKNIEASCSANSLEITGNACMSMS